MVRVIEQQQVFISLNLLFQHFFIVCQAYITDYWIKGNKLFFLFI